MNKIQEIVLNRFCSTKLREFQILNRVFLNRDKDAVITLGDIDMSDDKHDMIVNQLRMMHDAVKSCAMCPIGRQLFEIDGLKLDPHVFSNMSPSKIMIIAQNPGTQECIKNTPLVGPSGMNLDDALKENGLKREDFYISNIVKCLTLKNRQPSAMEIEFCISWLEIEIKLLRPFLIVTLGALAFDVFFRHERFSDNINKVLKYNKYENLNLRVLPTYHPSPRNLAVLERKEKFYKTFEILAQLVYSFKNQGVL